MNIRIISKLNKQLNAISYVAVAFGVISIIVTGQTSTELWASITVGLIIFGVLCITISWAIRKWNKININIEEVSMLTINSESANYFSKKTEELNYLGNWLTLSNGMKYEIDRVHIKELTHKLDRKKIEIENSKDSFYNASPVQVLKELLKLGP